MKRTRHTPEQIVRKLREADRLLAENTPLAEVMRSLGVSHQTYQRWRSQYAAMRPDDVARLKTLEKGSPFASECRPVEAMTSRLP